MRIFFAWIGGAVFILALATVALFYGIQLGYPAPDGSPILRPVLIDLGLFTAFAAHHSLLARSGAKAWIARLVSPALERSAYVWIASMLLLAVCWWWQPLPDIVWAADGPFVWLAHGVQLAGAWLTFRGAAVLDPLELAGIRQATGTNRPVRFTVAGPYRLVRHPIYLGWICLFGATPLMTASRLLWVLVSSAYLVLAIPWEERSLLAAFGDRYRDYQHQVRWRIVPGLW